MTPEAILAEARRWIGTPYRHAASLRGIGCDCLGLVVGIRRALGHPTHVPPSYAVDWAEATGTERLLQGCDRFLVAAGARPDDIRPGLLLLFRWRDARPASHLGLAVDRRAMIHAHARASVAEVAISPAWSRRLVALYRFPEMM
jgi:NlpC/P60 family putative phage cell wall peptidase